MKKIIVGIIGGTGKMGQFFRNFFEKNGFEVLISPRSTKLSCQECAAQSDIVIVSVPIGSTIKVIEEISSKVKKNSLLMDFTSLKKGPVEAMIKHSKSEIIGMHPIFGPNVNSLKNQTIVLCPARGAKWLKIIKMLFEKNGAKIILTSAENHDKMMSLIQGLNHFSSLNAAHAMSKVGISIDESLKFTSPIYKLRMAMVGRILNQDPELYASIIMDNPNNEKIIEEYINSANQLLQIIKSRDHKKFLKYFKKCSQFFGDFRKEAEESSDYLIEKLVEKGK